MPIDVVVADDLTGAADTLVQFVGCSDRALVFPTAYAFERAAAGGNLAGDAVAVAVSSGSRHLSPGAAAVEVRRIHLLASHLRPRLWFQKIDSALRGNPGAEAEAYRAVTGAERVLLCPAFLPSGRTVRDGTLFVNEVPLAESALGGDLRSPTRLSSVREILRTTTQLNVTSISRSDGELSLRRQFELAPPGIVVADAGSEHDLRRLATLVFDVDLRHAVSGSAGLAGALAARLPERMRPRHTDPGGCTRVLVVYGSPQPLARRQLAVASRSVDSSPIVVTPGLTGGKATHRAAERLADTGVVFLSSQTEEATIPGAPAAIAGALAATATAVVAAGRVDALVLSGGDVAAAVCEALAVECLELVGQVFPGAPVGRIIGGCAEGRLVVTKSGTHGDERGLLAILEALGTDPRATAGQ